MLKAKKVYEYSGPVIVDGQRATWNWTARTWAVSPKKARSNLIHRFKEQNNLYRNNRVELDGNVKVSMSSAIIVDEAQCSTDFLKYKLVEEIHETQLVLDI